MQNGKIGYVAQDGISYDVSYGYTTLFAYLYENEQGRISPESLNQNIGLHIRCGTFSYAEVPEKL